MARRPRQKTLAQRRANPALRSRLPASKLTPGQRKERTRLQTVARENQNPLYDPAVQLAGHSLIQGARDIADIQVNPKVGALNRQLQSVTTQGGALAGRAGDYYRQLAAEEAKKVATQTALGGMLNTQTAAVGQQTQQAFDQMAVSEQQRQASDVALRGQGLGGDVSVVPAEIQAQRGTAATLQQAAGTAAAQQGSEWSSLANAMAQSRQLRGGEVQGQLLNRVANQQQQVRGQISDVEATRGDLTSEALTKLRQQGFENLITQQGLNIKTEDLQAQMAGIEQKGKAAAQKTKLDTRKFKADQAYKQAQIDIKRGVDPITGKPLPKTKSKTSALDQWRLDYARKHGYLPQTGPRTPKPGEPGAKETADARKTRQAVNSISTEIQQLAGAGRSRTRVGQIMRDRARRSGQRLPEDLLSAALDLGVGGHISPRNVQMLQQVYGVTVPASWRRRPRTTRKGLVNAAQGSGVAPLTSVPTL